jgi:2-(1,2-epoxy-1,2-dihydrophenyl)acetyl-CoA isomerase
LNPITTIIVPRVETLQVERAGGIVTVTMNRPEKKNAINAVMWNELLETFRAINDNYEQDRVVVVTGAGGEFCSGADLSGGGASSDGNGVAHMRHIGDVCVALHSIQQPTIAKVVGVAAGAGLNLALGCDLVVASDDARFSEIFARRGLTVDFGGSWVLPRLVGLHKAKELVLLADIIDAKEAMDIGLVNRVVPASSIDAFVEDWARRLAAGPPLALSMSKRLLDQSSSMSLVQAVEAEAQAQSVNFASVDTAEAMAAFIEKREPKFEGR